MSEYKVKFEVFEGPLDLLLYLIKKQEVDIYEVNLTQLATQFIEYIDVMRMLDLEIAGEFLVMASTLMYIKSRELLPVDQQVQVWTLTLGHLTLPIGGVWAARGSSKVPRPEDESHRRRV